MPPASRRARTVALTILALTVLQLAVAEWVPGLPQFEGKAFGARLVFYPLLMLLVPAVWAGVQRLRGLPVAVPWDGVAWLMAPFLVDVTGNTLDLYDSISWWDDLNHLVNWFLLCLGVAILVGHGGVRPPWALGLLVGGIGALLAVGWELGEWYTFIRHGTELDTAYEDTLGDLALGTTGGIIAGVVAARRAARQERAAPA